MHAYFTALSFDSVVTAMAGDGTIGIANDQEAVSMPLDIAVEAAADTLRLLLDDDHFRNHRGEALANYLAQSGGQELRRILSRIGVPGRPTFANC